MKININYFQWCIALSFLFVSFSTLLGQMMNDKYQTETIYLRGTNYVKNEVEYPIGYFGQHLKKEMAVSSNAVIEFKKFEQNRKSSFIFSTIGIASMVSALFVNDQALQYGLFLGGLGLSIASVPMDYKAKNSFQKAIWLRNGAVLN